MKNKIKRALNLLKRKKWLLTVLAILPFVICVSIPLAAAKGEPLTCCACRVTAIVTKNPGVAFCK